MHDVIGVGQRHTSASLAGLGPWFSKARRLALVGSYAFTAASKAGMPRHCQMNGGSPMPSPSGMLLPIPGHSQRPGRTAVQRIFILAVRSSTGYKVLDISTRPFTYLQQGQQ